MDELKYIVEMVLPTLETGGAWVLAYFFMKPILTCFGWITVLFVIAHMVKYVLHFCANLPNESDKERQLQHIRDNLNIGSSGLYTIHEHQEVLNRIDRLMAKK